MTDNCAMDSIKSGRFEEKVAHVFWDCAPHLAGRMASNVCRMDANAVIYLYDVGIYKDLDNGWELSKDWVSELPTGRYRGYLRRARWTRDKRIKGHLLAILHNLWLPLTLKSLRMIIRGPKYWVFHGKMLPPMLTVFFRMTGKRIVVIHWGGRDAHWWGGVSKRVGPLSLRALTHFFVLIEPEVAFFRHYLSVNKISTLPYCTCEYKDNERLCSYDNSGGIANKCLMLGPSAWHIDAYADILDKIPANSWDDIVCIVAYGKKDRMQDVDSFIEKYAERFGSSFHAWRDRVPYDEYKRRMRQTPYYICPANAQAGLGAIGTGIRMGKTIFLRGDNYRWITSRQIKVFNLDDVKDFSYEGLSKYRLTDSDVQGNKKANKEFYTKTINPHKWVETINTALGRI